MYFPPDSYYYIDIYADDALKKFGEIITKPVNKKALTHARNLILSKYMEYD